MSESGIGAAVRAVLAKAMDVFQDSPDTVAWLRRHLDRMDEPLRVAIAGKVKAGKSTLLNALVGEEIAATDAGECTRLVTWYQDGRTPSVTLYRNDGMPHPLPVIRTDGKLVIELDDTPVDQVDRLVVDWPSWSLRATTLIDTPGIGSASTEVSARTTAFIRPEDEPAAADAVIYLMRHLHTDDVRFLESFHDNGTARATPVNTIAVLSRADEIGGGRIDALQSARGIARRYRADQKLRGLCQTVVPVAGLLAQTAKTLRQAEFAALSELAAAPREDVDSALLSADRFVRFPTGTPPAAAGTPQIRAALLDRFGLFGLRLSVALIRQGFGDSGRFAAELVRRSGVDDLRGVLSVQFAERGELLKARTALLALERLLRTAQRPEEKWLSAEVERIMAGAHEFAELRLLSSLRSGEVKLPTEEAAEADRLLGGQGLGSSARLGLDATATPSQHHQAALAALGRWRRRAESPVSGRAIAEVSRLLVRSCEGLLVDLAGHAAVQPGQQHAQPAE
jgi:Dynamin family